MRILILVVAGGAALIAAMLVRNMSNQSVPAVVQLVEEQIQQPEENLLKVLVATADLPVGHRLSADDLAWQAWPEEYLNESYYTEEIAPDATMELAGSVVRMATFTGEPILDQKIVSPGENGILAAVVREGMRAVAVEISVETAAGGFIVPNDHVDVILSHDVEVTEGDLIVERPASRTVLQNVRVLAIDQSFREIEGEDVVVGSTATLELNPRHVEVLMLAERMGDISLTLRGVSDVIRDQNSVLVSSDIETARDVSGTVRIYRSGSVEHTAVGGNQ